MFILFSFLTVYESFIQNNRVLLIMAWWVSLGTLIYFATTLIPYRAYFNEKRPMISDGPHPFYDWKLITCLNCFCLQASIHLIVLQHLQDYDFGTIDPVRLVISYGPLMMLICDWFASRMYFPTLVSLGYCYVAYALGVLSLLI